MANLEAVTTSNGARIKQDKKDELEKYLQKYYVGTGDMTVSTEGGVLEIYGYDVMQAYLIEDDSDVTDKFLKGLAPYLAEPLVVQVIEHEACRYPLLAQEEKIHPNGRVEYNCFKLQ